MGLFEPINVRYVVVEREVDRSILLRSTLVDQWIKDKCDVIVIAKSSITEEQLKCMFLSPYDLAIDGESDNKFKRSFHDLKYTYLRYKWKTDNRVEVPAWHKAVLARMHSDWFNLLYSTVTSEDFIELNKVRQAAERKKYVVYPKRENVYRAYQTRPDQIRVVLLGQDPYPNGEATGLAFGVDERTKWPPSLQLIERALELTDDQYLDSTLMSWAEQGVMLLNSALSVRAGEPGSYAAEWENFIIDTLVALQTQPGKMVFALMGKQAQQFQKYIDGKHLIINVEHPAAAARANRAWDHKGLFKQINQHLLGQGSKPIQWHVDLPF